MAYQKVNTIYNTEDENLNLYIKEISKFSVLSDSEQKQLLQEYRNGNNEAKQKLINCNLKLVVHICRRYFHDEFSIKDLIQEGNCALMDSVDKFDINSNYKFSLYVAKAIENRIVRYIQNNSKVIRIPVHLHKYIMKYDEILLNNPNVTDNEICSIMNINQSTLKNIRYTKIKITSLEAGILGNKELLIENIIPDDEKTPEEIVLGNLIFEELLSIMDEKLTKNEKEVITYRYCYGGFSQREIGNMLGLTRQRIEQIEKKALYKLKNAFLAKQRQIYFDQEYMRFKRKNYN